MITKLNMKKINAVSGGRKTGKKSNGKEVPFSYYLTPTFWRNVVRKHPEGTSCATAATVTTVLAASLELLFEMKRRSANSFRLPM